MIHKYPRTRHLVGSRYQPGDEDMEAVPFSAIAGRHVVVEEKVDGANVGISFASDGTLQLQSRGHYLVGGPRERHFDLFKQWANTHAATFHEALGSRYILYGEWLYIKHTAFYDSLPHSFLEFDILDTQTDTFLDTARRSTLLTGLPIVSLKPLFTGILRNETHLCSLLKDSHFKTPQCAEVLRQTAEHAGLDPANILNETDLSQLMEGLYIKVEEDGVVRERLKFVRSDFRTNVTEPETHWLNRPIIQNILRNGADVFAS